MTNYATLSHKRLLLVLVFASHPKNTTHLGRSKTPETLHSNALIHPYL